MVSLQRLAFFHSPGRSFFVAMCSFAAHLSLQFYFHILSGSHLPQSWVAVGEHRYFRAPNGAEAVPFTETFYFISRCTLCSCYIKTSGTSHVQAIPLLQCVGLQISFTFSVYIWRQATNNWESECHSSKFCGGCWCCSSKEHASHPVLSCSLRDSIGDCWLYA